VRLAGKTVIITGGLGSQGVEEVRLWGSGRPAGGHLAYSASKGGLGALSRTVAVRYGRHGVRCNTIYPGVMPAMRSSRRTPHSQGNRDSVLAATPLGRAGSAREVAQGVVFLASDDASYISGADLAIDGGFVAS
jgi:NAD(P)-dependent dehydrogenase (short-subunit alcohol dehydrogenase family)